MCQTLEQKVPMNGMIDKLKIINFIIASQSEVRELDAMEMQSIQMPWQCYCWRQWVDVTWHESVQNKGLWTPTTAILFAPMSYATREFTARVHLTALTQSRYVVLSMDFAVNDRYLPRPRTRTFRGFPFLKVNNWLLRVASLFTRSTKNLRLQQPHHIKMFLWWEHCNYFSSLTVMIETSPHLTH